MKLIHWIVQQLLSVPKFPGRDYFIEKLPKWFLKTPNGASIVSTRFGFKIHVDPVFDQNIENVIYERGVYELGTVSVIQNLLSKGDVFIDAGANIGFLSLVGAAKVGAVGKVYAFEPVPQTFDLLEKNKLLNHFNQIETFPFALGSKTESVNIYPEEKNRGGASILNQRSEKGIEIDVNPLDSFIINGRVKLIKVDVEGYELEVLKGAKKIILKDRPALIVEYSNQRSNSGENHELYHWIRDLGVYNIYRLKHGKERKSKLLNVLIKKMGLPKHDNIICLPKEK